MDNKTDNKYLKRLEEIADEKGDLFLMQFIFWDMFNILSKSKQVKIVKQAEEALEKY